MERPEQRRAGGADCGGHGVKYVIHLCWYVPEIFLDLGLFFLAVFKFGNPVPHCCLLCTGNHTYVLPGGDDPQPMEAHTIADTCGVSTESLLQSLHCLLW